jgi:putative ABC transport system ATP-binding protein
MALIEMKNIKKDYFLGETVVHALQGIDLQIDKGEFVAIWGPSGSGKTTLLNLIGAIDEPTKGKLMVAGKNVHSLSDNRRSELRNETIGYIFQGFNLVPVLSALENVMLPLQIKGASPKKAKAKALSRLEEVGISEFAQHRPAKMSGSSGWPLRGHWQTIPPWSSPMSPRPISIRRPRASSSASCAN